MSCVVERCFDALAQIDGLLVSHGRELGERSCGIVCCVERDLGIWPFSALPLMPLSLELCVLLLQVSGIQKNDLDNIVGGVRAVYLAREPFSDQLGQQPTVVEMGMG